MSKLSKPLFSGLRILDLTRAVAGPTCTRMFAELGAEVIKIEAFPDGDLTRHVSKIRNERSLYFVQQNLGKKSFCVDVRDPKGLALVKDIVPHVDVVVENFKPGVMAAMGLSYDDLKEIKDDVILCSISSMGQTGPLAAKPGYDYIAQSYAGVTSMIGDADDAPYIPLLAIGDVSTGVMGSFSVLAALYHRDRTGEGQHLDVAILDSYYHCHEASVHQYSGSNGEMEPVRSGRHMNYLCPGGVFRANGGDITIMSFLHHWPDLCAAMDRNDLVDDERLGTDAGRLENIDEVVELIETWLKSFPDRDSAMAKLDEHGVPAGPVLSIAETVASPHHRQRGTVRTINDRIAGEFDAPGLPPKFSRFPDTLPLDAPTLGEHNAEIMRDLLGRSVEELEALKASGVLKEKNI
jgi:crotonobetainyl-CoA:carnitine CoA-transferase CaiB-like acyl-CoA transferase